MDDTFEKAHLSFWRDATVSDRYLPTKNTPKLPILSLPTSHLAFFAVSGPLVFISETLKETCRLCLASLALEFHPIAYSSIAALRRKLE